MNRKIYKILLSIIIAVILLEGFTFAEKPYTPSLGDPERKVILDTLREGLKGFQEQGRPEFQYGTIPEDINVKFLVDYIKIKDHWALVEARVKDYIGNFYALLNKKGNKWNIKGIVDPQIFSCSSPQECIDINHSIYKKFKENFPQAPVEIFPEEHPERRRILKALRESIKTVPPESVIFIVKYLKIKNGWAWIETDPRGLEHQNYEPIDALLHKEKGKWLVKNIRPCCGDCEDDPYCAKGIYHKKLMQMFPSAPKEIFPNKTR